MSSKDGRLRSHRTSSNYYHIAGNLFQVTKKMCSLMLDGQIYIIDHTANDIACLIYMISVHGSDQIAMEFGLVLSLSLKTDVCFSLHGNIGVTF